MGRLVDKTGQRNGYLVIVGRDGKLAWKCQCDCGNLISVRASNLTRTKSCGCRTSELISQGRRRHGHTANGFSPTYYSWTAMKNRCLNPKSKDYHNYGGRGIAIHKPWLVFANFLADVGERPEGMTLDRIDPNGGYEPSNVRWATPAEQTANKR